MIHPDTELRRVSSEVGYGVFATKAIPRGTLTWVPDDLDVVLSPAKLASLPAALQPLAVHLSYSDPQGNTVVCWDFARYMNHSCEPTTLSIGTICDVAMRDIAAGEQLTCEYSVLNLEKPFDCRCGAPRCRGRISLNDLAAVAATVDQVVAAVVPEVARRAQPLRAFARATDLRRLDAVLSGKVEIPSILENRPGL